MQRKSASAVKRLVERAKQVSGNAKYGLDRMPKGHWMRKDAAKAVRKQRINPFGKKDRGLPPMSYKV